MIRYINLFLIICISTYSNSFSQNENGKVERLWGTYFGGSDNEYFFKSAIDGEGNMIMVGETSSKDFPVTENSDQKVLKGSDDAFIGKFDSNGKLLWSRYFGGDSIDMPLGVCIDKNNSIYICGTSNSPEISTPGVFQPNLKSNADCFIAKFSSEGELVWCTYLGGDGNYEELLSISLDNFENLIVTGHSDSKNSITTNQAHQTEFGGGDSDILIAKMSNDGSQLYWCTVLGGSEGEWGYSVKSDSENNIYVSGSTKSSNNISTKGAFKENMSGLPPYPDAFLSKFDTDGNIIWSTYFGDTSNENFYDLAIDKKDNIILTGMTSSTKNISTESAYQKNSNGTYEVLIAKFDKEGNRIWSSFFGSYDLDYAKSIALDDSGCFYICGYTQSDSTLASKGAYCEYRTGNGVCDAFFSKFDENGYLIWSSYLGGDNTEYGYCILTDNNKNIYLTGRTSSKNNIATIGAFQELYKGAGMFGDYYGDAFLVKFHDDTPNGVNYNFENCIMLFPNPTTDKLAISQIPDGAVSYEIFDIFGNKVLPLEAIHELPLQIDVSSIYPGVYFLKLNNQPPVKFIKL